MVDWKHVPLAIVGLACRLPGASHLDEYWNLLVRGGCAIREIPPEQFSRELYYDPRKGVDGKSYSLLAGTIDYSPFDPQVCPRPKRLASFAESGQMTFCQVAAEACRHAGLDPFNLPQRNVGVYVGSNVQGDREIDQARAALIDEAAARLEDVEPFRELPAAVRQHVSDRLVHSVRSRHEVTPAPVGDAHYTAAIVADALGLVGPAMTFDSACASSMYVLAAAGWALRQNRIEAAIVGGATFFLPDNLVYFSKCQALSATGSRPFSAAADGLVLGEGYVAVVVKTLPRALAERDRILAVVKGVGLSCDGRGKGLWAPVKEGQVQALRRAYPNVDAMRRLQYIEAHATATPLGDSVELSSLAEVLQDVFPSGCKIPIGSVKANIGHVLESAGFAGLVKVVMAIQHRLIPRQIAAEPLTAAVCWDKIPLFVPKENLEWAAPDDGGPRRAALSAFGVGGANGHLVVDEYLPVPSHTSVRVPSSAGANGVPLLSTAAPAAAEPVAVLGIGCVLPGATSVEAFWKLRLSGLDATSEGPAARWDQRSAGHRHGGFIHDFVYDWRTCKVPPKQIAQADPLQYMLLQAAETALAEGGYALNSPKFLAARRCIATFVGLAYPTEFWHMLRLVIRAPEYEREIMAALREQGVAAAQIATIRRLFRTRLDDQLPAFQDSTASFVPSTFASRIARVFDLNGGVATICAGWCSSSAALMCAADALGAGDCDMVLCAAGQRSLDRMAYDNLQQRGLLSAAARDDVPDASPGGIVPAEGAAVLLLKRLSDALRDGDPIRGILHRVEGGFGQNVHDAAGRAIRTAWRSAAICRQDVLLAGVPGTGRPDWERSLHLLHTLSLGAKRQEQALPIASSSAQFGHLQGAAGMVATIDVLLALEHGCGPGGKFPPAGESGRMLGVATDCDPAGEAYHVVVERAAPVCPAERSPLETDAEQPAAQAKKVVKALWGAGGSPMLNARIEGVRIAAVAAAVPEQIAGVADLAAVFGRAEAERLSVSTGVVERRLAGNLCASDLCVPAVESVLAMTGCPREEIGVLVMVTQTPDYLCPATACVLHGKLGLEKSCGAFDVNLGCSGYVYGLWLVGSLMAASRIRRGLLLCSDTLSRIISPEDRNVVPLFGDAGSATLLELDPAAAAMNIMLATDGARMSCLINPAGGFRNPRTPETAVRNMRPDRNVRSDEDLHMNGALVFDFVIREVPPMIRRTLETAGWTQDEVDVYFLHQANRYMLDYLVKRMRLLPAKVPYSLEMLGNTSSATIPLTMAVHYENRLWPRSEKCVMAGFGVGLSWASASCELDDLRVAPLLVVHNAGEVAQPSVLPRETVIT